MSKPKILGLSGSLRSGSFNTTVLNTLAEALGDKADMSVATLNDIPLYDQDAEDPPPASVAALRDAMRAADAIIIASPEYNHSTSGVLKNGLDWASRPYGQSSFAGKPVLIITSSPSMTGGVRAHSHLYDVVLSNDAKVVGGPQIVITSVADKIENGRLTDKATLDFTLGAVDRLLAIV